MFIDRVVEHGKLNLRLKLLYFKGLQRECSNAGFKKNVNIFVEFISREGREPIQCDQNIDPGKRTFFE